MRLLPTAGFLAGLFQLALVCAPAAAHDVKAGDLIIEHPWARATPGGAQVAGGYLTIVNKGTTPDRLVGGSIASAAKFGLHHMTMDGGVMKMRPTGPLEVPAGGQLTLDPSGTHIMFTGVTSPFKKGEKIEGTLVFERAGTVAVQFDVEGIAAKAPTKDEAGHAGHEMPGMDMN